MTASPAKITPDIQRMEQNTVWELNLNAAKKGKCQVTQSLLCPSKDSAEDTGRQAVGGNRPRAWQLSDDAGLGQPQTGPQTSHVHPVPWVSVNQPGVLTLVLSKSLHCRVEQRETLTNTRYRMPSIGLKWGQAEWLVGRGLQRHLTIVSKQCRESENASTGPPSFSFLQTQSLY